MVVEGQSTADRVCRDLKNLKFVTSGKSSSERSQHANDVDNCLSWKKRLQRPKFSIESVKLRFEDWRIMDRRKFAESDVASRKEWLDGLKAATQAEIDKWHPGTPPD